jgi:2-oxoglutarate ferredoxin oxidoreductase subunit beta
MLRDRESGRRNQIRLRHGEPILFNDDLSCVYVGENGRLAVGDTADVDPGRIVTHDAHGDPSLAFSLAHLAAGPTQPTCIGVFHEEQRPVYGQAIQAQIRTAVERLGEGDLEKLLRSGDTWTVG